MYDMMKKQNYGVEIDLTGITREKAAQVIAEYYGTTTGYAGTYYHTYTARDRKGRTWKAMSYGSIDTQRKVNGNKVSASGEYSCEVVTPSSSTTIWRTCRTSSALSAPPVLSQTPPAASTSMWTEPTTRRTA